MGHKGAKPLQGMGNMVTGETGIAGISTRKNARNRIAPLTTDAQDVELTPTATATAEKWEVRVLDRVDVEVSLGHCHLIRQVNTRQSIKKNLYLCGLCGIVLGHTRK